jgi:hypothetical protein
VYLACAVALLVAEVLGTLALSSGFLSDTRDEFRGPEDILALVKGRSAGRPYVLILGDSVMKNQALEKAGENAPREKTVPAYFERLLKISAPRFAVVDASMEGALAGDYNGIVRVLESHSMTPSAVVLQLDYRLFSKEHEQTGQLSRKWLKPYVDYSSSGLKRPGANTRDAPERFIDSQVYSGLLLKSNLFLFLRNGLWALEPSNRILKNLTKGSKGKAGSDDEAAGNAALKLLVAPYYQHSDAIVNSRAADILNRAIDSLSRAGVPVLLVFSPVNFDYLYPLINVSAYEANRAAYGQLIQQRYADHSMVRLVFADGTVPQEHFLDHCHLTAEGNQALAKAIMGGLYLLTARQAG